MNVLFLITSIIFFTWVARNLLFWISLWQVKEYRFDRMFIHLRETHQGKKLLFSKLSFIKWVLLFLYGLVIFNLLSIEIYQILIFLAYLVQGWLLIREMLFGQVRRPVPTVKSAFIFSMGLLIVTLFYYFPLIDRFPWVLFIDRIITFFIAILVLTLSIPTEFYRDMEVQKAIKKIKTYKNLLIIGVTGSYGKSSSKEYVAQILQKGFRVVKTQGTNNTPIGLAQTILSQLKPTTEIFVAEMGAYKKGEIKTLCQIAPPKIGILTAVNQQHVSLFGSLENTMKAKYELIDAIPADGISLFNGNNENAQKLYHQTKKRKVLYEIVKNMNAISIKNPDSKRNLMIYAFNVVAKKTHITFDVYIKNKIINFETPLLGAQQVENILPGIYIAFYLGMKEKDIKKAVSSLTPLPKTMILHQLPHGPAIIDDTFTANPASVFAALEYMKQYKGKKMLVFMPMIELGKDGYAEHYAIGLEVSKSCDFLLLTNKNFYQALAKGIKDGKGSCKIYTMNPTEIAKLINSVGKAGDVIVFEGRETNNALLKVL